VVLAACLFPIVCAAISVLSGQDCNWDLQNYHLYNAYAFLTDRVGRDWAPAQMQTYFNPVVDVPYYLLMQHGQGRWVAALYGAVHGLGFALLACLAATLLRAPVPRWGWVIAISFAGCASPIFLAEMGSTMGDLSTGLLVLGGVALLIVDWETVHKSGFRAAVISIAGGFLLGSAAGLKLTNSIYVVAGAAAWLLTPMPWRRRALGASATGIGAILGLGVTSGGWFWNMWQLFGNPVFPQFNTVFHSGLASGVAVLDTRFQPVGLLETVFYPLVFTLHPTRIAELPQRQLVLPLLYLLFLAWGGVVLADRWPWKSRASAASAPVTDSRFALSPNAVYLLGFIAIAYLSWLKIFGIQRYLVTLEMLAPIAICLLLRRIFSAERAATIAKYALICCMVLVLTTRKTWGHAPWAETNYVVDFPAISQPASATVILLGSEPMGWMAPFLPREALVGSLGGNFPESPAFRNGFHDAVRARGGEIWVVLPTDPKQPRNEWMRTRYGLLVDVSSCEPRAESIGRREYRYQFCRAAWPG
jgi:hypothetical protein